MLVHLYQQSYPHPTAPVQECLEEIELPFLSEDLTKVMQSMRVGTNRIREIVLSLRNFSRLDEAEVKDVNIHEGIDSTLTILHNRLKTRAERPEIQTIKDYGNLPLVECYAGQLNQVFMNIISNAIDALEERDRQRLYKDIESNPSTISIRTEVTPNNGIGIYITDNGPGMQEQVRKRIFDPFFTTKPVGKGTGLGLSISYQIVTEKHGGKLWCNSSPGQGTQFIIEIPIKSLKT
ncbi:MAG: HAMP domain-containing histidine kinase [Desertifilum sp. SIO1I2]|nr:HAMP domain-containing histidine kinase [Desertifilum sp. SIO1I2]